MTGETGTWGFSALTVGLNAAFYRAARPDTPFQVAMQRGVRMYHDQTTRPLADLRWELLTLLSHGAFVTLIDKTGFDGSLDPVAYRPTTARPLGRLIKPHRTARQREGRMGTEWPMSPDVPVGPAALLNQVGAGTVLTLTASPDFATASEHSLAETRRWFANAVRMLHPEGEKGTSKSVSGLAFWRHFSF